MVLKQITKKFISFCLGTALSFSFAVPQAFAGGGTVINTVDFSEANRVNRNSGSDAGYWTQYRISPDTTKNQIVLRDDIEKAVFKNNVSLPDGYTLGENAVYLSDTSTDRALKSYITDAGGGIKIPFDSKFKDGNPHDAVVKFEAMGYSPLGDSLELTWETAEKTVMLSDKFEEYSVPVKFDSIDSSVYFELACGVSGAYFCIDNIVFTDIEETAIVSGKPEMGSISAATDEIEITFNNVVEDDGALDINNYSVSQDGISVTGVNKISEKTYLLKLSEVLHKDETAEITVSGLTDEFGIRLGNLNYSFYVAPAKKPAVISVSPEDGSINVDPSADIRITFDIAINPESFGSAHADINGIEQSVNSVYGSSREVSISANGVGYGEQCSVNIGGIMSEDGASMDDYSFTYTTSYEETDVYQNNYSDDMKGTVNLLSGEITDEDYYSAPSSLKLYAPKSGSNRYYPSMENLKIGKYYRVSFKAKKPAGNSARLLNVINSDEGAYLGQAAVTEEWQTFTYEFEARYYRADYLDKNKTETEIKPPRIACDPQEDASVVIYVDDLKITEIGETKLLQCSDIPLQDERNVEPDRNYTMEFNYDIKSIESIAIGDKKVSDAKLNGNKISFGVDGGLSYGKAYTLNAELTDKYNRRVNVTSDFFTKDALSYDQLKVYSFDENELLKDLSSGENINLKITKLQNSDKIPITPYIVFCLYSNSKMIAASASEITIPGESTVSDSFNLSLASPQNLSLGKYYIKIFFLNGKSGTGVLSDCVTIGK